MRNEIESTIQYDKLTLCCVSTKENNFNHLIMSNPDEEFKYSHFFGNVTISKDFDYSRRYKHCYNVRYEDILMGKLKFGLYGQPQHNNKIWFSMHNQVDYKYLLQFLPTVFNSLDLKLNNVTRMEIALDGYYFNFDQHIRKCLQNKDYKVKLFGRYIQDGKKLEERISHWSKGSRYNFFMRRSIYIKNKRKVNYSKKKKPHAEDDENTKDSKTTIELCAYNKLEEIENCSPHKTYILDYHKDHNPKYKHIYREEIRLESEELRRFEQKRKKPITLTDLLNKEFLYEVFTEYIDRIIVVRDGKGNKIDLFPKPYLGDCKGKLPLTLPPVEDAPQLIEYKEIPVIETENIFFNNKEDLREDFEEIINNNPIYFEYYENNKKIIRSYQAQNKRSIKKHRQSKFRAPIKPHPPKQYTDRDVKLLEDY